jgi:hypothetical protein
MLLVIETEMGAPMKIRESGVRSSRQAALIGLCRVQPCSGEEQGQGGLQE